VSAQPTTTIVLALDVGTSSLRASLYDDQAASLKMSETQIQHHITVTPDGGAELDAETLFADLIQAIDGAMKALPSGAAIVATATSTLWHSVLGVDAHGKATTPLYTWADTRAAGAADDLRQHLDEKEVHARTGCVLHPSYLPARLLWLSRTFPDQWKNTARWLSFGEYMLLRFFGKTVCSYSMASGTGLLDVHKLQWDPTMLDAVGLDPKALSPLVDLGKDDALSGLTGEWATRWPALANVPWFPAVGDGACSNAGSGGTSPRRIAMQIGTSSAMRVMLDVPDRATEPGLWFYRVDKRRPLIGGALSEGGNVFAWLRSVLQLPSVANVETRLSVMKPAGHGLTMLPFLAGERSPDWAASARGAIDGLTLGTTPLDIVRAALESIAYRFALIEQRLRPLAAPAAPIVASGGALLSSPAWLQMMADVMGRTVIASTEHEASSRGAVALVLEALGLMHSIDNAAPDLGQDYSPDPARHEIYAAAMKRQADLYGAVVGQPRLV